jgi:hypothetical protein
VTEKRNDGPDQQHMSVKLFFFSKREFSFKSFLNYSFLVFIISPNKNLVFFRCLSPLCAFTCKTPTTKQQQTNRKLVSYYLVPVRVLHNTFVFFLNRRATADTHTHTLVFIRRMKSVGAIMTLFIFSPMHTAKAVTAIYKSIYIRCICI